MRLNVFVALVTVFAHATALAQTDVQFGGSRRAGMAGAGLALPGDGAHPGGFNPAALAGARGWRLGVPSGGYHIRGLTLTALREELRGGEGQTGIDRDRLADFALRYGNEETRFGANASLAVGWSQFAVSFGGEATAGTIPNESLRAWAAAGSAGLPPEESRLDGFGFAFTALDLSAAHHLRPTPQGDLSVGARVRSIRSYYSHHFVTAEQIVTGEGSVRAPEMGDEDVLTRSGLGVDLGAIFSPLGDSAVHYGLVIENAIQPSTGFEGTAADGSVRRIDPFRTSVHTGVAWRQGDSTWIALDWNDLGNHTGRSAVRGGIEVQLAPQWALRIGYSSGERWSFGLSLGGVHLAVSREAPLMVTTGIRF
jgi:hypothetical protein